MSDCARICFAALLKFTDRTAALDCPVSSLPVVGAFFVKLWDREEIDNAFLIFVVWFGFVGFFSTIIFFLLLSRHNHLNLRVRVCLQSFLCVSPMSIYVQNHRIIRVVRDLQDHHQPNTTMNTLKPYHQVLHPNNSWALTEMMTPPAPRQLTPIPNHSLSEIFFLVSNLNLTWCNLRPFALVLSLETCQKRLLPTCPRPLFRWL